jgi:hypothetical protein
MSQLGSALLFCACLSAAAAEPAEKKGKDAAQKIKEVAGTAEFLRSVPKHFAALQSVDAANHRVTLLVEGERLPKIWTLTPDAEIKVLGWWGRLDQLTAGDRVWAWFKTDRRNEPVAISMLADELSQQYTQGDGVTLQSIGKEMMTVKPAKGSERTLKTGKAELWKNDSKVQFGAFRAGDKVYAQSTAEAARLILDSAAFQRRMAEQRAALRKRWIKDGLPGTVTFLHIFSGEMDLMLDHEATRWGRSLKLGDAVKLKAIPPITAVVRQVQPWRERTQVRLVVNGIDQADLVNGQRIDLKMTAPPVQVDEALLPADTDRPRTKGERIEWFLASIYCTCGVGNDTCTGHFYTLASCNPNGCGMPNATRQAIAAKIERGLTDKQIFDELLKERGPSLLRPHLLP